MTGLVAFATLLLAACGEPPAPDAPSIVSFTAGSASVEAGGSVALGWETRNATAVALSGPDGAAVALDAGSVPTGTASVTLTEVGEHTYTLLATGEEGTTPAEASVTVTATAPPAPTISSFTLTPEAIAAGETSTLAWEVVDAARVVIDDATEGLVDSTEASGQLTVSPSGDTTYTLTATGRGGDETQATATLTVHPVPVVDTFEVRDEAGVPLLGDIVGGSTVVLAWDTTHAASVSLADGQGNTYPVDATDGTLPLVPEVSTTYTLTAVGPGGSATATASVSVLALIQDFTVAGPGDEPGSSATVRLGDVVTLSWATHGATGGTISGPRGEIPVEDLRAGTAEVVADTFGDYTLSLIPEGRFSSATVSVALTQAPRIRSLTATPNPAAVDDVIAVSWEQAGATWVTVTATHVAGLSPPVTAGDVDLQAGTASLILDTAGDWRVTVEAGNDITVDTHLREVALDVRDKPIIEQFSVRPTRSVSGGEVTVQWETIEADTVTLTKDGAALTAFPGGAAGSFADVVVADATYQLVADNGVGQQSTSAPIVVSVGNPEIKRFASDRTYYAPESEVGLSWENLGGRTLEVVETASGQAVPGCSLTDASAHIELGGCTFPAPVSLGTHGYRLRIADGAAEAVQDLEISVIDGPVIRSFTASDDLVTVGGAVTFSALVDPGLDGGAPVFTLTDQFGARYDFLTWDPATGLLEGTWVFGAAREYVFTLEASTEGTTPSHATAAVSAVAAPTIYEAWVDDPFIESEGTVVSTLLRWKTRNATSIRVYQDESEIPFHETSDPSLVANAAIEVSPTTTTGYRVVAYNDAGSVATALVRVGVDFPVIDALTVVNHLGEGGDHADVLEDDGNPSTLDDQATVSWSTHRADSVAFSHDVPVVAKTTDGVLASRDDPTLTGVQLLTEVADSYRNTAVVRIPFPVPFYGEVHQEVLVSANGWASFDLNAEYDTINSSLPQTRRPKGLVAVFHDSVRAREEGMAWTAVGSDAQRGPFFLIQWEHFYHSSHSDSDLSFQVKMFASGDFEFTYGQMVDPSSTDYSTGRSATIGFQNLARDFAFQYSYNEPVIASGDRLLFDFPTYPAEGSLAVAPYTQEMTWSILAFNEAGVTRGAVTTSTWPRLDATPPQVVTWTEPVQVGTPVTVGWGVPGVTTAELWADGERVCTHRALRDNVFTCDWTPAVAGTSTVEVRLANPVSAQTLAYPLEVASRLAVESFLANGLPRVTLPPGAPLTLTWQVTGDVQAMDLVEAVSGRDLATICPDLRTTSTCTFVPELSSRYDLYFSDVPDYADLTRVRAASVEVLVSDTAVRDFQVSTSQIWRGGEVALAWEATSSSPAATYTLSPTVGFREGVAYESLAGDQSAFDVSENINDPLRDQIDTSDLGFSFPFDGQAFTRFAVDNTGVLEILVDPFDGMFIVPDQDLYPDPDGHNGLLAPYMVTTMNPLGRILSTQRYKVLGPPDARQLVVEWFDLYHSYAGLVEVQLALFADGRFEFRYGDFHPDDPTDQWDYDRLHGEYVSVGWENLAGDEGVTLVSDEVRPDILSPGRVVTFYPETTSAAGTRNHGVTTDQVFEFCARGGGVEDCRSHEVVVVQPGDVTITELMIDPSPLADGDAEWVELRNTSRRPLDLQGWTLSNGPAVYRFPEGAPLILAPGEHLVVAAGASDVNGGIDTPYVWDDDAFFLDDDAGELVLSYGPLTVDRVAWERGPWTIPSGASLSLDPSHHGTGEDANDGFLRVLESGALDMAWCKSAVTETYPSGLLGSPGEVGLGCRYLGYDLDRFTTAHDFIDIRETGLPLPIADNEAYMAAPGGLGFTVDFYGVRRSALWVSSNGWVSIEDGDPGEAAYLDSRLPHDQGPGGIIAPFWDDLRPWVDAAGWPLSTVHLQTVGEPGQRITIVQWTNWDSDNYLADVSLTFQVQIHESGDIVFAYETLLPLVEVLQGQDAYGRMAACGIESPNEAEGIQVFYHSPALASGDVTLFRRRP